VHPRGRGTVQKCEAMSRRIAPDYFQVLGIPVLAGRDLRPEDGQRTPIPVLVNKTASRFLFGNENPIGRQLSTWYPEMKVLEIVGVVGDARQLGLKQAPGFQMYLPTWSPYGAPHWVLARTAPNAGDLTAAIRRAVLALDPEVPAPEVTTMDALFSREVAKPRFYLGVLGAFAATGVILAALGIYGVMAYSIVRRTQEFGIRMALGAGRGDIQLLVLGQAMRLIGAGAIIGVAGALAVTRLLSTLLYGVQPNDPLTFVCVVMLLSGVALLTAYMAALRAGALNPMTALRHE
jgi:putative ABC transport system permease protein